MAKLKPSLLLLVAMVVASMEFHGSAATEYVVGDSLGWNVPHDPDFYVKWSQSHIFKAGDVLVFNFNALHDVGEVTRRMYENCDTHSPLSLQTKSPARYTLYHRDYIYFLSTEGQDCNQSMKLAIKVSD